MMHRFLPSVCAGLLAMFGLSACETPGETALLGAGIGAVAGRHTIRNAAIGAGAGYLVGKLVQADRRDRGEYDDRDYDNGYRDREYRGRETHRYPYADSTERRGFVISPSSGNVIDVRGIPHGAKVVDPSTNRVFLNP